MIYLERYVKNIRNNLYINVILYYVNKYVRIDRVRLRFRNRYRGFENLGS